jgi:DNA-binding NarL/FixJ family response regulator
VYECSPDRPLSELGIQVLRSISLGEPHSDGIVLKAERIMRSVLIVDDDHAFRTVLRTLFDEGSGFDNCVEAANASEAFDKAKQLSPNLVVVNFSIPEMNGFQFVRRLKTRQPELPIFILSADYNVDIEKEALAFGITAVFSKLDDLTTLIANARVVCGLE